MRAYARGEFPNIDMVEYTIKDIPSQIAAELYSRNPHVLGFSVYIWNVEETIRVIQIVRKVLPDVKIVLGGPEVSYDVRWWMERLPEVDFIIAGEGEESFLQLLRTLYPAGQQENVTGYAATTTPDFATVGGLAWRDGAKIRLNPAGPKLNLDAIPSPYDDSDLASLQNRIVYFETSRGCPFSCQFCLSSIESGVRYFDIHRVKQELQRFLDAGIKTTKFVDRTFNLNRQYAMELFQFLIDNRRDTVFQFEITGDILPPEVVDFLGEHAPAGLFRFEIGVQSTNDATNALVKRRQNFEKLSRTIQHIKQSGRIVQHLDLIAGLPEEDYQSFRKTFDDVYAFEPEELQLGFLKMLRGTGLRERATQHDYVFMDTAPYEILSNNVLSYDEVLRIKQVEDVLEKYWNEGRLRRTTQFLTQNVFTSPFDFFQQFGAFWAENGWNRIGHQLEDLFLRLELFLASSNLNAIAAPTDCSAVEEANTAYKLSSAVMQAARSLMKLDYLTLHRVRPTHKVWWRDKLPEELKMNIVETLASQPEFLGTRFTNLQLNKKQMEKHMALEFMDCSLDHLLEDGRITPSPSLLAVYYPPGPHTDEQVKWFTIPLQQLLSGTTQMG